MVIAVFMLSAFRVSNFAIFIFQDCGSGNFRH
jgi:hypothetical protein